MGEEERAQKRKIPSSDIELWVSNFIIIVLFCRFRWLVAFHPSYSLFTLFPLPFFSVCIINSSTAQRVHPKTRDAHILAQQIERMDSKIENERLTHCWIWCIGSQIDFILRETHGAHQYKSALSLLLLLLAFLCSVQVDEGSSVVTHGSRWIDVLIDKGVFIFLPVISNNNWVSKWSLDRSE